VTAPTTPAPEKASVVEDFVDIFASPAAVFRRRAGGGWGLAFLIIFVLGVGLFFALHNVLISAIDADITRGFTMAAKKNPALTADVIERMRGMSEKFAMVAAVVSFPLIILCVSFLAWLMGKLFGSKAQFGQMFMVATYSAVPRVIGTLAVGAQGFFMDPTKITGMGSLSIGPARFLDPDAANPLMLALATRFDVFTIWATVLLGIGVYAVGKTKKDGAALTAVLVWLIATAFAALGALRQG
jgi:uncharacterized integral membrane protein